VVEAVRISPIPETRTRKRPPREAQGAKGRQRGAPDVEKRGRYIRPSLSQARRDLALDATLRAAAPHAQSRPPGPLAVPLAAQDLRGKIRSPKTGLLFIFVVDASGSMGTKLMAMSKGAVFSLLERAYQDRNEVALVAFKDKKAALLLPPTKSISLATRKLSDLPTGGTTPLASGIAMGLQVAKKALTGKKTLLPCLVLVTDGKANIPGHAERMSGKFKKLGLYDEVFALARAIRHQEHVRALVIDAEEKHPGAMGMAREIADQMGAAYMTLQDLKAETILQAFQEK